MKYEDHCIDFVSEPANKGTTVYPRHFKMTENLENFTPEGGVNTVDLQFDVLAPLQRKKE